LQYFTNCNSRPSADGFSGIYNRTDSRLKHAGMTLCFFVIILRLN